MSPASPVVTTLAQVVPRRVRWLWHGRIALGKLTIIEGPPGVGKSSLMLDLAARVSTGAPMPDGSMGLPAAADVLITAATEDGTADTIVSRLMAAGADLARVHEMSGVVDGGEHRPLELTDLNAIADAVQAYGVRYLVADAFMALIPADVNSGRDPAMRRVLTPLADLADSLDVAIIANRHHRKAGGPAIDKGGESVAIGAVARTVLVAGKDPADEDGHRKVLAVVKSNLVAPSECLSWSYEIASTDVDLGDDGPPANIGAVKWLGASDATAEQVARGPGDPDVQADAGECREMVRAMLAHGPRAARDVQAACRAEGFTAKQVRGARERLGVIVKREGFGTGSVSMWCLPGADDGPPVDALPPIDAHTCPLKTGAPMDEKGIYGASTGAACAACGESHHGIGSVCEACL